MMWCVIILAHMGGKMKKDEEKTESKWRVVRNLEPLLAVLAIIISIGALLVTYWSYEISKEANAIAKEALPDKNNKYKNNKDKK